MNRAREDLTAAAIQGTARRPPDPSDWGAPLGPIGQRLTGDPATRLLDAAAVATVLRRSGARASRIESVPLSGRETRAQAPPVAQRILGDALASGVPVLVEAVLTRIDQREELCAAAYVPALLRAATRGRTVPPLWLRVMGERGRWLANQNPEWEHLAGTQDPSAAVVAPDTQALPSPAAEGVLGAGRDGGDHEDEGFSVRAISRIRSWFREPLTDPAHAALELVIPDELSAQDVLDGIGRPFANRDGSGTPVDAERRPVQAIWVCNAVAAAPLSTWDDLGGPAVLQRIPPEIAPACWEGWALAVLRDSGGRMQANAGARATQWARSLADSVPVTAFADELTPLLAAEARSHLFEERLIRALRLRDAAGRQARTRLEGFLRFCPHPWPSMIMPDFLDALPAIAVVDQPLAWRLLGEVALHEPTTLLDDLAALQPLLGGVPAIRQAIALMSIRHQLDQEVPAP